MRSGSGRGLSKRWPRAALGSRWGLRLFVLLLAALFVAPRASAAVDLSTFTVSPGDGKVFVDWTTASEIDFAGFFVRRNTQNDGNLSGWPRVTVKDADTGAITQFIPARNDFGADYNFIDENVQNDITYYYALEAVNSDQSVEFFGPVFTTPFGSNTSTPAPTLTPSPTTTLTPTQSQTPPGGLTFTPTPFRSPTVTLTRTPVPTPTITPIPSITPTITQTPTPSNTPTETPLPTFLPTLTATASRVPTRTRTPTASVGGGPLLESTLSPEWTGNALGRWIDQSEFTLGDTILLALLALLLTGGVIYAGVYYFWLRNEGQP